jgi:hypothetical protein
LLDADVELSDLDVEGLFDAWSECSKSEICRRCE